jgi:hypothetical protein
MHKFSNKTENNIKAFFLKDISIHPGFCADKTHQFGRTFSTPCKFCSAAGDITFYRVSKSYNVIYTNYFVTTNIFNMAKLQLGNFIISALIQFKISFSVS